MKFRPSTKKSGPQYKGKAEKKQTRKGLETQLGNTNQKGIRLQRVGNIFNSISEENTKYQGRTTENSRVEGKFFYESETNMNINIKMMYIFTRY